MYGKIALGIATAALALAWASPLRAEPIDDGFIGLGARFSWDDYKTPLMRWYDDAANNPGGYPELSSTAYDGPKFGGVFHWGITNQLVLSVNLDFGYFNHTMYPYPDSGTVDIQSVTAGFWQIGAMVGVKYFFWEREEKGVSMYISGNIGAYFSGCTSDIDIQSNQSAMKTDFYANPCDHGVSCDVDGNPTGDVDEAWGDYIGEGGAGEDLWSNATDADSDAQSQFDAELDMVGDLASPFVFEVALGVEFFATDTFSIGADVLGVRLTYAAADTGKVDGTNMASATWTGDQSYLNLYVYSALTMNFNLTAGRGEGEDEDVEAAPAEDDGWGESDGWGAAPSSQGQGGGWGTTSTWSTGPAVPSTPAPAAPQPAPPEPAPEPAPSTPEPAPSTGGWGTTPTPPPPPPPPSE